MNELESRITELVGEASMLFGPGVGDFDTTRAKDIVNRIMKEFPTRENPWLGLASTRQLLNELASRAIVGGYADYRTVDEK
jgi:hypothetical protein